MIRLGVTVVLLLAIHLTSQVKGQDSNCQDIKNGFRINYQCELKCFEYAFKMRYTGDFCNGKPELKSIEQDKFTASDVDKAIRCISAMCKLKVPSSVCDDYDTQTTARPDSTTTFIEDYDDCDDSNGIDSDVPPEDSSNSVSDDVLSNFDEDTENVPSSNDSAIEVEKVPNSNLADVETVQSSDSNSTTESEHIPAPISDSVEQAKPVNSVSMDKADSFNSDSIGSEVEYSVVTVFEDVFVDDDDDDDEINEEGIRNAEMNSPLSANSTTQEPTTSSGTLINAESYEEVTKPDENMNFALTTLVDLEEAVQNDVTDSDFTILKTTAEDDKSSSPVPTLVRSRRSLPPVEDYPNGKADSLDDCDEEEGNETLNSVYVTKLDDCDDEDSSNIVATDKDINNIEDSDTTTAEDSNLNSLKNENYFTEASQNIEGENVKRITVESSDDSNTSSMDDMNALDIVTSTPDYILERLSSISQSDIELTTVKPDDTEIVTKESVTVYETIGMETEIVTRIDSNKVTEQYLTDATLLDFSDITLKENEEKTLEDVSFETDFTIPVADSEETTNKDKVTDFEELVITSPKELAIEDQTATTAIPEITEFPDDLVAEASNLDQSMSYEIVPDQSEDCNEDESSVDNIDDNLQDCDDIDGGDDDMSIDKIDKGTDYTLVVGSETPSSLDVSSQILDITVQNFTPSDPISDLTTPELVTSIPDSVTPELDVPVSTSDLSTLSVLETSPELVTDDIIVFPTESSTKDVDSDSAGSTFPDTTINDSLSILTDAGNSEISDAVESSDVGKLISSNLTELSNSTSNKSDSEAPPLDSPSVLSNDEETMTIAPNDDEDCDDYDDENDDYYNDYLVETDENTYDYADDDDPHPVDQTKFENGYDSNSKTKIKNKQRQTGSSDDTSVANSDQNYNSYDSDWLEEYENQNPSQTSSKNNYPAIEKYQPSQQSNNNVNQYDNYEYNANQKAYPNLNQASYSNSNSGFNNNPSVDYSMQQQNVQNSKDLPKKFAMDFGKDKLLVNGNTVNWFKENNFMKSYSM